MMCGFNDCVSLEIIIIIMILKNKTENMPVIQTRNTVNSFRNICKLTIRWTSRILFVQWNILT